MTSFTGYIQGITSGEKRTVDKTGKMVSVSAYDNIDNLIVFNEAGETTQDGTPTPSNPVEVKGIGLKQSDGTYSVFLDYDADEERFGRITASGLAYPLYEGDILDFVNGKVIRANGALNIIGSNVTLASETYTNVKYARFAKPDNSRDKGYATTNVYCEKFVADNKTSDWDNADNIYKIFGGAYLNYYWLGFPPSTTLEDIQTKVDDMLIVYSLANPVEEPITITGDITDIGTAVVTAEGTLTIKYDKAKMAIRKYRNPPEWSEIGYESTPTEIITAFDYAKNLQDTWTGVRNFYGVKELYYFPNVNMKNSRGYGGMFQNTNLMHVPPIIFGEETITGNANADGMFRGTYVEDVSLTSANSTQKFSMNSTFYECFLLKSVTLNLKAYGNLNTMFYNCKKLTSVSGEFDTSEVTELKETFRGCNSLTHAPSSWDTSSCTSFWRIFTDCTSLQTAPNWNLRNATDLSQMFWGCTALKHVPPYYIPSATNLNGMFQGIGSNLDAGSQNDILLMCANASSYTGTKTLAQLGFNASMYPASSWQGLSKYADFIDAGWTIGYN